MLFKDAGGARPVLRMVPHGAQVLVERHRVEQALGVSVLQMTRDEADEVPREYVAMEEVEQLVPQHRAQQRSEQVVDVPVPQATVAEMVVEKVLDVPVQVQQREGPSARAASSSVDAPQGHIDVVFPNFLRPQISANSGLQSTAGVVAESSSNPTTACGCHDASVCDGVHLFAITATCPDAVIVV